VTLVTDKQSLKGVLQEWAGLSEVMTTPIVYHGGGWADTLSNHIKQTVLEQRLEKVLNGGWDMATDAEVVCYLSTASLEQPLGSDWTDIYLYEAATLMPQIREAIPHTPKELSDYQNYQLSDLKRKIRDSQKRRRKSNRKENNMSNRKLVLEEHNGSVLVGVLQDGCDPVINTKQGSIEEVLSAVPDFLKEAQEKWAVSPKNPAYKAPVVAKKTTPPAAPVEQPGKAEDLPLLSATAAETKEPPAETKEPPAETEEPQAEAEEPQAETEEPQAEPQAEAEVTEPAAAEPIAAEEPEAVEPTSTIVTEEETEQEIRARIAGAPAPQPAQQPTGTAAKSGEWEYYLQDGRGPFVSVQLAMDEMGLDKNNRPLHNRWDRLSTALKEKIQRRPKA